MNSGIAEIDRSFVDPSAQPVDTSNRPVVAAVQALLAGHGFRGMPTLLDSSSGCSVRSHTRRSPRFARASSCLMAPGSTGVRACADHGFGRHADHLASVCGAGARRGLHGSVADRHVHDGARRQRRVRRGQLNTDRCGLSFGLIQWAQRPGRLHELLLAWDTADPDLFTRVFGEGDADLARALLMHTAKPSGGVDARTGITVDARFDLVAEPWRSRFASAAREPAFQRQQIASAVEAFERSLATLRQHVPVVISERGFTAMLDVANQFGDAGALSVAAAVLKPGMSEADFLLAVQAETVLRVGLQYGDGSPEACSTANRRQLVRTTPWLTDAPLDLDATT